jgi:hypothetical protein
MSMEWLMDVQLTLTEPTGRPASSGKDCLTSVGIYTDIQRTMMVFVEAQLTTGRAHWMSIERSMDVQLTLD